MPTRQQRDTGPSGLVLGILAGSRAGTDAVALAEGVAGKVLVQIDGVPMLERVLNTLAQLPDVKHTHLCGPDRDILAATPWLAGPVEAGELHWLPTEPSPARSAAALLDAALTGDDDELLLTTGDHPLLTTATATAFLQAARAAGADVVVGLARHAAVQAAFPNGRRTALKLADGPFCGCNLFYFRSRRGLALLEFWQRLEADRKRPGRMAATLGFGVVLRYLCGRLTSRQALDRITELTGVRVAAVAVADPDAAVDVDSLADLALVRARMEARRT